MENIKILKKSILLSLILLFISVFFWGCDSSDNENIWVAFEKSKVSMVVGEEQTLSIIVTPESATDTAFVLSSNNESVVSVKQDGTITAVSVGTATITATSVKGANSANCVVTVLAEPTQLSAPTNISFDGDKIVWGRVQNKFGYKVILNETELDRTYATNFFRDFAIGVENVIKIKAIGDGSAYLDSEWSEEFTFTVLDAPTISIFNNKISFSSQYENARFDVYLDGSIIKTNHASNYIIIDSSLSEGSHIYKIKQVGNSQENIYSSTFSNEIVVKKLSAPKNAVVSASVLTFDAVIGAQGYMMELKDTETGATNIVGLTSNTYNFGNNYVAGKYDIRLMSLGDSSTILSSGYSTSLAIDKLNAPTNITVENGIISWDRSTFTRNGFLVNVYDISNSQSVQIIPTAEYFYNFKENYTTPGLYRVTIIATGDNQNASVIRYINSSESEPLEITKLSVPSNIMILDNKLVWDEVENCLGYELIYNSQTIFTTENSFTFLNTDALTFPASALTVNVRTIGDEQQTISSEQSADISFTKLGSLHRTDFSVYQSRLSWRSVQNCMRYRVYVNDNEPVEVNTNYLDFDSANYNAINFSVRVQALSTTANYVMGEPSAEFTFQKLGTPTNIAVENGYLTWSAPENTGVITAYRIKIGDYIYNTKSNLTQSALHDYMLDGSTQAICVQAICEDEINQFMWGNFSEPITLTKLSSNFNAKIINGEYTWDRIENASSYAITIQYSNGNQQITENMEYSASENRAITLLDLDFFDESTTYSITIQALGTTGGQYLSSKISPAITTTRLAPIQNLRVSTGVVRWELDENADRYELYIDGTFVKSLGKVDRLSLDETYAPGDYDIKIFARGNQTTTLNAKEMTEPLQITKLNKNFNISTDCDFIVWDPIQHATSYAYELRNPNNVIVSSSESVYNPQLSISNLEWHEFFYLRLKAMGDNERYINSDFAANGTDSYYIVRLLHYPTNLSVERGILSWDYVDNTDDYKIIISGVNEGNNVEKVIPYTKEDNSLRGSYNIANYISLMNLTGELRIVVRAVGGQGVDAYLSSDYSDEVRVTKLATPTITNVDGVLTWNLIENSRQYKVYVSIGASEIEKIFDNDVDSYELDSTFSPGNYNITIQAIGNDIEYLSSERSATFESTKLSAPTAENNVLRISGGYIVWDPIINASLYYVEVLKYNVDNTFSTHTTTNLMPDNTLNSYLFRGAAGNYKIKIKSIGESGTRYLNSDIYNYDTLLTKLSAPDDLRVQNGILIWSDVGRATKYMIDFSGNKRDIGKTQSFEMQNFAQGQYGVSLQSVGDDMSLITSDYSQAYQVYKIKTAELELKDYVVTWDKDYSTDHYEIIIKNLSNNQVTNLSIEDINNTSFDFNEFNSDYYSIQLRYVAGSYEEYSSIGYVSSEWSDEFPIFKLEQIQNFKLENDYTSPIPADLEQLGAFSWSSLNNATDYKLVCEMVSSINPDFSLTIATAEDIQTLNYMFGDDIISNDGIYRLRLTGYNKETITHENVKYNVVRSDESIINTMKLPAPTEIYAQNANLYWMDPKISISVAPDLKYMVYWKFAELNDSFDAQDYNVIYADEGIEHTVFDGEQNVIKHSMPVLSGIGKYQFMICTVGENCIRSTITSCEVYVNEDENINTYHLFDFFESGKGSETNPYLIKTFIRNNKQITALSQLNYLNYLPNDYFLLQEDITLDSDFVPIGELDTLSTSFNGTFNGNNKNITGASFNSLGSVGLFNLLKQDSVVKNLNIDNFEISGSYNIMGFVTSENYGTIQNVNVLNSEVSSIYGNNAELFEGGIAGKNYGTIKNCKTKVYLHAQSHNNIIYVGGITGYNEGIITQCSNSPMYNANTTIYENQIRGTMAGGIAGFNLGENAEITECSNCATVYAYSNGSGLGGYSYGFAGGIVGRCAFNNSGGGSTINDYPLIENCYNVETVRAYDGSNINNSNAGGIVGSMSGGSIANCYNVGNISIIDTDGQSIDYEHAGGLIGSNDSQNSLANNSYFYTTNIQNYIPINSTPLNSLSNNVSIVTQNYLIETLISDKYTLVANEYQKLLWETE